MNPERRAKTPFPPVPRHAAGGKFPPPVKARGREGLSPPPREVQGGGQKWGYPRDPGAGTRRPSKSRRGRKQEDRAAPPQLPPRSSSPCRSRSSAARQHPLTFAWDAVWGSPIKNHPLKKRIVVDVLRRPRRGQAAALAALLLAEVGFVEDLAAPVPRLAEPAVPSCGAGGGGDTQTDQWRPPMTQTQHVRLVVTFTRLLPFICPVS